jgi:hypothetical protein
MRRAGHGRCHSALAAMLGLTVTAACSTPGMYGNTGTPAPRSTYQGLVIVAPSRHITYPGQMPPGGCLLGGTPPDQYPLWLCVQGVITSGVTQSNYRTTGCDPRYERRMRPPASEIREATRWIREEFRLGPATHSRLDWLVPLSLGGANNLQNIWPVPTPVTASRKRKVDQDVQRAVCAGTVGLTAAQSAMAANWTTAEISLGIR